jgi:hypothetical protein
MSVAISAIIGIMGISSLSKLSSSNDTLAHNRIPKIITVSDIVDQVS